MSIFIFDLFLGVSSLTFFSGNGGAKFSKKALSTPPWLQTLKLSGAGLQPGKTLSLAREWT